MKNKRIKGSISLFLTLIMVPTLIFGAFSTDITLINCAKSEARTAADLAANAVLADYNELLLKYYGLFAVSLDMDEASEIATSILMKAFDSDGVLDDMSTKSVSLIGGYPKDEKNGKSTISLNVESCKLKPSFASSPANPTVLKNRISEYLEWRGPLTIGESILEKFDIIKNVEKEAEVCSSKIETNSDEEKLFEAGGNLYDGIVLYQSEISLTYFAGGIDRARETVSSAIGPPDSKQYSVNLKNVSEKLKSEIESLKSLLYGLIEKSEALINCRENVKKSQQALDELIGALDEGDLKKSIQEERDSAAESYEYRSANEIIRLANDAITDLNSIDVQSYETIINRSNGSTLLDIPEIEYFLFLFKNYLKEHYVSDTSLLSGDSTYEILLEKTKDNADSTETETTQYSKFSEADVAKCFSVIDALCKASAESSDLALDYMNLNSGDGDEELTYQAEKSLDAVSLIFAEFKDALCELGDDILELDYLCGMFSCASDKKESALSLAGESLSISPFFGYEIEYLVYGFDSANAGKAAAIASISAIRFALNTIYLYSNAQAQAEVTAMATALAGWTGIGIPIVKNTLMIAWSVAETAMDMKKLLDGEDVAVYKTPDSWLLSLEGLVNAAEEKAGEKDGKKSGGFGDKLNTMSYRDYLTLFLAVSLVSDENHVLGRCAKLIQINLSSRDKDFNITGCWTIAYLCCEVSCKTLFFGTDFAWDNPSIPDTYGFLKNVGKGKSVFRIERLVAY